MGGWVGEWLNEVLSLYDRKMEENEAVRTRCWMIGVWVGGWVGGVGE